MNKAYKLKLLCIFGISLVFYFVGCVDTSVQNLPSSLDFHSRVQIVNLAAVNGNVANIDIVNSAGKTDLSTGQINVGGAYPDETAAFQDIPSGSKTINVTFAGGGKATFKLTIDTDRKIRLVLYNPDAASTDIIKGDERYIGQSKDSKSDTSFFVADSAAIDFLNSSPAASVSDILVNGESLELSAPLGVAEGTGYMMFGAGEYTFTFLQDTTGFAADTTGLIPGEPVLGTANVNAQSKGRYSAILYGTPGNFQAKVYTDD